MSRNRLPTAFRGSDTKPEVPIGVRPDNYLNATSLGNARAETGTDGSKTYNGPFLGESACGGLTSRTPAHQAGASQDPTVHSDRSLYEHKCVYKSCPTRCSVQAPRTPLEAHPEAAPRDPRLGRQRGGTGEEGSGPQPFPVSTAPITPLVQDVFEVKESGKVAWDMVWQIFPPNEIVWTTLWGVGAICRVSGCHKEARVGAVQPHWCVTVQFVDWNGSRCGLSTAERHIPEYVGYRSVVSFIVHPLSYLPDSNLKNKEAMARGVKFQQLRGCRYMNYDGIMILITDKHEMKTVTFSAVLCQLLLLTTRSGVGPGYGGRIYLLPNQQDRSAKVEESGIHQIQRPGDKRFGINRRLVLPGNSGDRFRIRARAGYYG